MQSFDPTKQLKPSLIRVKRHQENKVLTYFHLAAGRQREHLQSRIETYGLQPESHIPSRLAILQNEIYAPTGLLALGIQLCGSLLQKVERVHGRSISKLDARDDDSTETRLEGKKSRLSSS